MAKKATEKPQVPLPHAPAVAVFDADVLDELRAAQGLREAELKKIRAQLEKAGLVHAVNDLDASLRLHVGDGPTVPGLKAWFGPGKSDDGQMDMEDQIDSDKPNYGTWELTIKAVQGMVAKICSDETPVKAMGILTALEAGEKEKKPQPRDGVLEALRTARSSMKDQVSTLAETPPKPDLRLN